MSKKDIHVVPHGNGWATRKEGASRASRVFPTQKEAADIGRAQAKRDKVEFLLHGKDGKIRSRDSYGDDPCPPRDKNT